MIDPVKTFRWDEQKNAELRRERGISFEDVVYYINNGNLLDIIAHPNKERYAHQKIFLITIREYVHYVPFVENEIEIFLETITPSRKLTKRYFGGNPHE